jgi:hypothetical protein
LSFQSSVLRSNVLTSLITTVDAPAESQPDAAAAAKPPPHVVVEHTLWGFPQTVKYLKNNVHWSLWIVVVFAAGFLAGPHVGLSLVRRSEKQEDGNQKK